MSEGERPAASVDLAVSLLRSAAPDPGGVAPEVARLRALSGRLANPELAEKALEILPDALVIADDDGTIRVFNLAAELLWGYVRAEVLGQSVEMLIPEAARPRHGQHRADYMAEPRSRPMGEDMKLSARHKSGREIPVLVMLAPLPTHEGVFVLAVVRRRK
jgi:PAS domain S-box-containing protein